MLPLLFHLLLLPPVAEMVNPRTLSLEAPIRKAPLAYFEPLPAFCRLAHEV